ncbi:MULTISPECIES: YecA family protein [Paenibacillus]|uniref:YecA family protein n=1 Tax=Paenibacillus TaxID=44249 RepID=UPI0022B91140|nr:SEC-C metal-binding domain-containing protein [Paenibacillus caseinilyticus]MCZ8519760.1 SEC-C metal-binding domain-containing protein [Paenibacillus caseinilyticus]
MTSSLSSRDQKLLPNGLQRAQEAGRTWWEKEEQKRWGEIELPVTLVGCLSKMTKDELTSIRSHLQIGGLSTLKKQELAAVLEERVPERLPWLLHQWDEARYGLLKKLAERGGQGYAELEPYQLAYFRERGIVFTGTHRGKRVLAVPREIVEAFRASDTAELRETVRRNTEWIQLTQGMLFYYGSLESSELCTLMETYTKAPVQLGGFLGLLSDAQQFHREFRSVTKGYMHIDVDDAEQIRQEHKLRADVPFYPFTKEQLLLASGQDYVDRHAVYRSFVSFIRYTYGISKEEADPFVEDSVLWIQLGESPGEVLEMLQTGLEIDTMDLVQAFVRHIALLHNNTRQWVLKGHTPNELRRLGDREHGADPGPATGGDVIDFATGQKAGRNDPCPCGSGAKYKKCCGR